MPETIDSFAEKVKAQYPEYRNFDNNTVTFDILKKAPQYGNAFTKKTVKDNIFTQVFKAAILGATETVGKTAEGIGTNLALVLADPTVSPDEYAKTKQASITSYEDYKKRNDVAVERQKSAIILAENVGKTLTLFEDTQFEDKGFGAFATQVARGLGQFAAYFGTGVAAKGIATAAGLGAKAAGASATAAVTGEATLNRQVEFIDDAEATIGKKLYDMNNIEKDKVTKGSIVYGATTGVLDATVFNYVAGMPGVLKETLGKLKLGKAVSPKLLSSALGVAAGNAFKRGTVEGLQESLGDGMVLDILAKNLYDDDREFITGDAVGRRMSEALIGFTVGGIASGIGDSARVARGDQLTEEGLKQAQEDKDKLLESIPDLKKDKVNVGEIHEVFDLNGEPETIEILEVIKEPEQPVKVKYRNQRTKEEGFLDDVGFLTSVNPRKKGYKIGYEEFPSNMEGKAGEDISTLSDEQIQKGIEQRQEYFEKNKDSEDATTQRALEKYYLDQVALQYEQARRARDGKPEPEPEPVRTNAVDFTVSYTDKDSKQEVTTKIKAKSKEEAEAIFKEQYKDIFDGDETYKIVESGATIEEEQKEDEADPEEDTKEEKEKKGVLVKPIIATMPGKEKLEDVVGVELESVPEGGFEQVGLTDAEIEIGEATVENYLKNRYQKLFFKRSMMKGNQRLKLTFKPLTGASAQYEPANHEITYDIKSVARRAEAANTPFIYDIVMRHEIMHAIGSIVAFNKGFNEDAIYEKINNSLTPQERTRLDQGYLNKFDKKASNKIMQRKFKGHVKVIRGAEYFRLILEEFGYGLGTEQGRSKVFREGVYETNSKAFGVVKQLLKDIQKFIANVFNKDLFTDSAIAELFIGSVDLLQSIDPKARPVNQKLIEQVRSMIDPNTNKLYSNVNSFTEPTQKFAEEQLEQETESKKLKVDTNSIKFFEKYLVPVGQLLNNIHVSLGQAFNNYIKRRDFLTLKRLRATAPFGKKLKNLKKKNTRDYIKLWQLISYSPNPESSRLSQEEQDNLINQRDALLEKHDMVNEYYAVRAVMNSIRGDATANTDLSIGIVQEYFPRFLTPNGRDQFLEKYQGIDKSTYQGEIDAENNRRKTNKQTLYRVVIRTEDGDEIKASYTRKSAAENKLLRLQAENPNINYVLRTDTDVLVPIPPLVKGSIEEELFLQKFLNRKFNKGGTQSTKTRVIELIDEKDLQFYIEPSEALSKYISTMTNTIETIKFAGLETPSKSYEDGTTRVEYGTSSEIGRVLQRLIRAGDGVVDGQKVDQEKLKTEFPFIYSALMTQTAAEVELLGWLRQASYFSLLTEFTSTMSQLYDLPFIMYNNGFLPTLKSMIGKKEFKVEDYLDTDRIVEENFSNQKDGFAKIIRTGLTITGFRKLDLIMKNTTMDANYKRYMAIAKTINLSYLNPDGSIKPEYDSKITKKQRKFLGEITQFLSPALGVKETEKMEFLEALRTNATKRTQAQSDLIASTLVSKLFENQPLSELRMPVSVRENPNLRMFYTMKSFMIVQLNTARNLGFNQMARGIRNGNPKDVIEGSLSLARLLAFCLLIGIPIDFLKDLLSGRLGYISDYSFNSFVRVAGINKYFLYKGKVDGMGSAMMDFALPAPLSLLVQTGNKMSGVIDGDGEAMDRIVKSEILSTLPFYDTLHYIVPEIRELKETKQRRFMRRRLRQEGTLFGLPDPFEQINPRPIGITRDVLGI